MSGFGAMSGKRWALRFISGKYQGGEFPLNPGREIVVGRSSELDMVLVEDMVSRKHAKILIENDVVGIQDLGSTNGTFVNGERVKKAHLHEGDRILIGTSILKLISIEPTDPGARILDADEARSKMEKISQRRSRASSPMSGRIEEVPLPDLLQLFSTSKKSGVVALRGDSGLAGKIYLRNGRIYYASVNDNHELGPQKAFTRLMAWPDGYFELTGASDEKFMVELDESTEGLLMDAMRELDEMARIADQCPAPSTKYVIARPLSVPLRDLSDDQLDVLQLVHNNVQVQAILDKSFLSDLDTYQSLLLLLNKGYLRETR